MDTTISDEAIEQIRQMQGEIADLRYESGMYQSLYEVSQRRVEELEERLANEHDETTIAQSKLAGDIERLEGMVEILRVERDEFIAEQLRLTSQLVLAKKALREIDATTDSDLVALIAQACLDSLPDDQGK